MLLRGNLCTSGAPVVPGKLAARSLLKLFETSSVFLNITLSRPEFSAFYSSPKYCNVAIFPLLVLLLVTGSYQVFETSSIALVLAQKQHGFSCLQLSRSIQPGVFNIYGLVSFGEAIPHLHLSQIWGFAWGYAEVIYPYTSLPEQPNCWTDSAKTCNFKSRPPAQLWARQGQIIEWVHFCLMQRNLQVVGKFTPKCLID